MLQKAASRLQLGSKYVSNRLQICGDAQAAATLAVVGGKLSAGQSCQHWWAGWFKDAKEPRMQIKKSARQKWYSAEIVASLGVRTIMYAGRLYTGETFQVH